MRDTRIAAFLVVCVGPDGQVFLLNKGDGVIRLLVPDER